MATSDQEYIQERTMITFQKKSYKFTFRVGGIAVHNGRVLCQRSTIDPHGVYWFLPGGRAELGESTEETLQRETQEELGETAYIGRLLYIIENFFTQELTHHELNLIFEMHFPADSYLYTTGTESIVRPEEDQLPLIFDWLPIAELPSKQSIRPYFLNTALQELPSVTQHIVQSHLR